MGWLLSTSPDITESLPASLSARQVALQYQTQGAVFDVSIGELPFMISPSDQTPYVRATAEARKQQLDTSPEPGEQTLSQWWTRSQDSWHRGAGVDWYEPGSQEETRYRYRSSVGVDVWTKGEARLLKKMALPLTVSSGQSAFATSAVVGGTNVAFVTQNGVVKRWDGSAATTYSGGTGTPATAVAVAGAKVLVGTNQTILIGDANGNTLADQVTDSAGAIIYPYWVKSRVIATRANKIHELTLSSTTLPGTPLWENPDTGWTWTGVAETPTAILAAGYSNGHGAIYRFRLVDPGSGSTPELGPAEQVAEFPPGEEVHSIRVYLGTYLAIGTTKGVRIGLIDSDGSISYGPLTVTTTKPVRALGARDSFVYAGVQEDIAGKSGVARIDLSQEIEGEQRYAWAYDVQTHDTGVVTSVAFLGSSDRTILGVTGKGIYLQSATEYEESGYLYTGNVRFATTVPKVFSLVQVRATIEDTAGVAVYTVTPSGETFTLRLDGDFNTDAEITLPTITAPLPHLEAKVVLEASDDLLTTPVLESLSLKAVPLPRAQRVYQFPLLCLDFETDRHGNKVGWEGAAWDRIEELEQLEESGSVVQVRDTRTGEAFIGWITQVQFAGTQPPVKNKDNFGGRVSVTVTRL